MKRFPTVNDKPKPIPFTKEAYEQMQQDFKKLKKEEGEILIRLQKAREMGDLSENGAYKYAKFELGNCRRELRRLRPLLRYGVVREGGDGNVVEFGNTVTLKNDEKEFEFMLVSEHESNPAQKKLSETSPFGKAVVGKSMGETVVVVSPNGETEYVIEKVE